jgi:hypothetical protein
MSKNTLQNEASTEFHVFDNVGTIEIPPCLKEFLVNHISNPIHRIKILREIFPDISLRDARNITRGWE